MKNPPQGRRHENDDRDLSESFREIASAACFRVGGGSFAYRSFAYFRHESTESILEVTVTITLGR